MKKITFLFSLFLSLSFTTFAQKKEAIVGIWLSEKKDGKIEVYKTGDKYFGKLVWIKDPLNKEGKPKLDVNNPEITNKTKTILGSTILKNLSFTEDNTWEDGTIYDPNNGKTYSCKVTLVDNGQKLNLRGFIGFSLIGRTSSWTKSSL